jgi:hypothetical protein
MTNLAKKLIDNIRKNRWNKMRPWSTRLTNNLIIKPPWYRRICKNIREILDFLSGDELINMLKSSKNLNKVNE